MSLTTPGEAPRLIVSLGNAVLRPLVTERLQNLKYLAGNEQNILPIFQYMALAS